MRRTHSCVRRATNVDHEALLHDIMSAREENTKQERVQKMNILFFLTPKEEVAHIKDDESLRQAVEKLEYHGYTAIPLLTKG